MTLSEEDRVVTKVLRKEKAIAQTTKSRISKQSPNTDRFEQTDVHMVNSDTMLESVTCGHYLTRGQSNLTKSASWRAHSPVRGHPRGSKFVPLNSWGRVSY